MDKEKIVVLILVIAVGALIIGNMRYRQVTPPASAEAPNAPLDTSNTDETSSDTEGRNYLLYNSPLWNMMPTVGNPLPAITSPAAQIGNDAGDDCFLCYDGSQSGN